jgi:hypothetical protein
VPAEGYGETIAALEVRLFIYFVKILFHRFPSIMDGHVACRTLHIIRARKQRDKMPALVGSSRLFSFIPSNPLAYGMVAPTFRMGLSYSPPHPPLS